MKRFCLLSTLMALALATLGVHNGRLEAQAAISTDGTIESKSGGFIFPDGSVQTTAPGQEFMRVAGSNFRPRDSDATFSYSGGGCLQRDSNVGDSWFTTDIQLPDGAVIDFMRVYFNDAHATFDVNSELWAFDGAGGTTQIAEADSSGSPGFGSEGSGFFAHQVDNLNETLVVVVSLQGGVGSALQSCGIRLRYQWPGTPGADLASLTEQSGTTRWFDPTAPDTAENSSIDQFAPSD